MGNPGVMPIVRGDRMFIKLSAIGECDAKGKVVLSFGYNGKMVAEPDKPLAMLAVGFISELISMARYSSAEAMATDLANLRMYLDLLESSRPVLTAKGEEDQT